MSHPGLQFQRHGGKVERAARSPHENLTRMQIGAIWFDAGQPDRNARRPKGGEYKEAAADRRRAGASHRRRSLWRRIQRPDSGEHTRSAAAIAWLVGPSQRQGVRPVAMSTAVMHGSRMRLLACAAAAMSLAGCDDCGNTAPAIQGLCEPRIQVGTQANVSIVYWSDTGPMPLRATSARSAAPAIAGVEIATAPDQLILTGTMAGTAAIELQLDGFDTLVWFPLSVETDPPAYQCDGRDPPGFDITNRGAAPAP